jgi:SAM-dependent methyltransferase
MKNRNVSEHVIQGVYSKELSGVCSRLLELPRGSVTTKDAKLVRQVQTTLEMIQAESDLAQQQVLESLAAAGITVIVRATGGHLKDKTYHIIHIQISSHDLASSFFVFRDLGFICPVFPGRGEFELFRRIYSTITLIKPDNVSLKMKVSWQQLRPQSGLMRFLRPSLKDSQALDLPASLWPLYYVIRPLRILTGTLTRRTSGEIAPFMGTPNSLIKPILEFASVTKHDVLVDLGCGDGRVVIETARVVGCRSIGVELDMALVERAQNNVAQSDLDNLIQIKHSNATEFNLNDATVIFLFLPIKTVKKLIPDLLQRLKPGSRIVTHEQQAPNHSIPPTRSKLILSNNAMTVAHLWEV